MKTKTKIIAGAVILAVLAFAFWYGGSSPGLHGWNTGEAEEPQEQQEAQQPADEPLQTAEDDPAAGPDEGTQTEETPAQQEEVPPAEEPVPQTAPETTETDPAAGQDAYHTDPVPEGQPAPVEPQEAEVTEEEYTCTISISCATILDHMDWLDPDKAELVPANGVILAPVTVPFYEGESVFNVLQRTCKQNGIHMEFENTPMYNSAYIEGIANLYEFDCGELSGWMYSVNGWFPNYGCSRYALEPGDVIRWVYTCDLGEDVGGGYANGN